MYEDDRKEYPETSQDSGQNEYTDQYGSHYTENRHMDSQREDSPYADRQYADSQHMDNQHTDSPYTEHPYTDSQESGQRFQNRMNMSHIPPERPRDRKKKSSVAAKLAGVTAAALLFGTVAGGAMFSVNAIGEYVKAQNAPEVPRVTVAQAETGETAGADQASAPVTSAIQTDVSAIVEMAMPSVVAINNTMLMQQQTWFGPSQTVEVPSSGSGIIVGQNDSELLIVTNNHVVEDSSALTVTFIDNEQVQAVIKGTDSESDLAVIAVPLKDIPADTMSQIKVATMGDSDALKVGQGVIAIGNALGYGQSVTVGYVSALNREVHAEDNTTRNLLQTDAAINPGNSGGALLNMKGEVIGINAAKYSSTEVEGMGYAIPISEAQDIINELMNRKTRIAVDEDKQGYLGIQGQNIDETAAAMYGMPRGIYVFKIVENSAASESDLREKDIITKFDGQTVRTMEDLKEMLTYYEGGDTVNLTVQSLDNGQYQERTVQITLGKKPAGQNS
ncbi:MAG: trypsin-like peptidase domain-containing protein [Eubacteriales bacterium]|nr:trypsin-like peptidase domain-containing protein [Eubacteriales bacterium]